MPPLSPSQTWSIAPKARLIPAATHRLELIEALRGFALFGVLLVNLRSFSLFEFMGSADGALLPTAERRDGPFSRALQPMRLLPRRLLGIARGVARPPPGCGTAEGLLEPAAESAEALEAGLVRDHRQW
jgi:hypothetical protein